MSSLKKVKLECSYTDDKVKRFTVYEGVNTVARFVISKKKKNINCALVECHSLDYLNESLKLVSDFLNKYADTLSEDRKDVKLPF